jgi:Peptidase family M23
VDSAAAVRTPALLPQSIKAEPRKRGLLFFLRRSRFRKSLRSPPTCTGYRHCIRWALNVTSWRRSIFKDPPKGSAYKDPPHTDGAAADIAGGYDDADPRRTRRAVAVNRACRAVRYATSYAQQPSCPPPPPEVAEPPVDASGFFWRIPGGGPYPVMGSDDRAHLAYLLLLTNAERSPGTLLNIAAVDPASGYTPTGTNLIIDYDGQDRTGNMTDFFQSVPEHFFTTLAVGGAGLMLMDVSYPSLADVPRTLSHQLEIAFETAAGQPAVRTVLGSPLAVSCVPPVVLRSPLRGPRWFNDDGCCAIASAHRAGGNTPVNGNIMPTQQFAIDWQQVRANGTCCTGDPHLLASWPFYGAPIYAAAGGTVVETQSDLPDQVPLLEPPKYQVTIDNAQGNHVIIDMGGGRYAAYDHMRPQSLPPGIVPGAQVSAGAVLGQVGNSGATEAPHLHFQVMDGPNLYRATSLPFVIDDMYYQGAVKGTPAEALAAYLSGNPVQIDATDAGRLQERMPLMQGVFAFH